MNSVDNLRRGYDEIYLGHGLQQRDSFYLWLLGSLKPLPGRLLIDISCGQARLPVLARHLGLRAIGADFSMDGLLRGRQGDPAIALVAGNGEGLPIASASADYVTHIGSLEHYLHPLLGAREIARILKPGGIACVFLPNAYGLLGNVLYVSTHGDIFDDGQPLQRYATRRCWETMLTEAGLKVQRVLGYGEIEFPRTRADVRYMLTHPQRIFRLLILPFIPKNLANHLVYLCSRD